MSKPFASKLGSVIPAASFGLVKPVLGKSTPLGAINRSPATTSVPVSESSTPDARLVLTGPPDGLLGSASGQRPGGSASPSYGLDADLAGSDHSAQSGQSGGQTYGWVKCKFIC